MREIFTEQSKKDWYSESGTTNEQISIGCLQRIAAASEAMAKNHIRLMDDLEYWKKRSEENSRGIQRIYRSNCALRGVITKMKKRGKK